MKPLIRIVFILSVLACSATAGAQNYGYDPSIQQNTNEMMQQQQILQQQQRNYQQEQYQQQQQQFLMQQMLQEQRNQSMQYQRGPMLPAFLY